jgi:hypothetical protein
MQDSPVDHMKAQQRFELAKALTDSTRILDRARKKIELLASALIQLRAPELTEQHIQRVRAGVVEIEQLNNAIRKMNV